LTGTQASEFNFHRAKLFLSAASRRVCYPTPRETPLPDRYRTASDDAVALIMALRSPHVRVLAITTVAGNVAVEQSTRNAIYTAELCGAGVPVFMGAGKPLNRAHQSAHWFHGRDVYCDPEAARMRRKTC
jgi:hypothetical protein